MGDAVYGSNHSFRRRESRGRPGRHWLAELALIGGGTLAAGTVLSTIVSLLINDPTALIPLLGAAAVGSIPYLLMRLAHAQHTKA